MGHPIERQRRFVLDDYRQSFCYNNSTGNFRMCGAEVKCGLRAFWDRSSKRASEPQTEKPLSSEDSMMSKQDRRRVSQSLFHPVAGLITKAVCICLTGATCFMLIS